MLGALRVHFSTVISSSYVSIFVVLYAVFDRKKKHREAYEKVIQAKSTLNIRPVRFNYVGLPRSGKTSFRRRLLGEIINIILAIQKGEKIQPSTGVAEEAGQVIIRSLTSDIATIQSKAWSVLKDLLDEANMLNQFFYQTANSAQFLEDEATVQDAEASATSTSEPSPSLKRSKVRKFLGLLKKKLGKSKKQKSPVDVPETPSSPAATAKAEEAEEMALDEMFSIIGEAMEEDNWDAVAYLLEDIILLINTDTGGQAEFLDLHASLVQGPSFNLLFSRLVDQLDSQFKVYYTNEDGESTEEEDSTFTLEEILFQSLSSIACFSGCFGGNDAAHDKAELSRHSKSKVMFVGTHRDLVTDQQFREKDRLLQSKIKNTEFYDKDIIEFASDDQLMLAVDNMNGSEDEIKGIQKILEKIIEKSFEKVPIPAAWLMLSLYIRKKGFRTMSLTECEELAGKVRISPQELQDALWFLHHRIGVLLYYPEVESMKGTVICDIQVLYDSATYLIKNTFTFDKVGKAASEKFREKAQFSLRDIKKALSPHTDSLIPLEKLVELLDHLSILTVIPPSPGEHAKEPNYFMPCVLKSARASKLAPTSHSASDPAHLMLHYECGYVPIGVFPAMITNLVSQRLEDWKLIDEDLRKNRVAFYVGEYYDIATLLSHPRYFEIAVSQSEGSESSVASLCTHVRNVIECTLRTVTSRMSYNFSMNYKLGFECPLHSGRDHFCMLAKEGAKRMECLENPKRPVPVPLEHRHRVWFAHKLATAATGPVVSSTRQRATRGKLCSFEMDPTGLLFSLSLRYLPLKAQSSQVDGQSRTRQHLLFSPQSVG